MPTKNYRLQHVTVNSLALNTQSKFFDNHLVANLGYREDDVDAYLNTEADLIGPDEIRISPAKAGPRRRAISCPSRSPSSAGAVSPTGRATSFRCRKCSTTSPSTTTLARTSFPLPTGLTKSGLLSLLQKESSQDYGVSFYMWNNKLVARINWYDAELRGATAPHLQ